MKNKFLIFAWCLLISEIATAAAPLFLIRTPEASVADFATAMQKAGLPSYVDWLLRESSQAHPEMASLNQALESPLQDPNMTLQKYQTAIQDLTANILNAESRELLVSIELRIAEMNLPPVIRQIHIQRAQNLIRAHKELQEIEEFKTFLEQHKTSKWSQQESQTFKSQLMQKKELQDAQILIDGEIFVPNTHGTSGDHQWVLVSNAFAPVIFNGRFYDFIKWIGKPETLKPLAVGDCDSVRMTNEQIQARIFTSLHCFENESVVMPMTAANPQTLFEPSSKRQWVIPLLLTLAAGAAYSLKDKNVTVRGPSFH